MTLDPQNTMTEDFNSLEEIDRIPYYANTVELVASVKYLAMEISVLKERMETFEEVMRILEWRMDNPGGDYYD